MPWLFFAALIAAGGVYYVETRKKAAAPKRAPVPVQQHADPVYGQAQDFFGQARNVTRQFQNDAQHVAQAADDTNRAAIAASGSVSSIANAVGSLARVMPGVFKDLGIDGNAVQKQGVQGLSSGSTKAELDDMLNELHAADAEEAEAGEWQTVSAAALGKDAWDTGGESGNDLGVDGSSADSPYQNLMFPISSGTAGTTADGVTPDATIGAPSTYALPPVDQTQSPIETAAQSGSESYDLAQRRAAIVDTSESNADYQASRDAWGDAPTTTTGGAY